MCRYVERVNLGELKVFKFGAQMTYSDLHVLTCLLLLQMNKNSLLPASMDHRGPEIGDFIVGVCWRFLSLWFSLVYLKKKPFPLRPLRHCWLARAYCERFL